jgi:hypothetical protein
MVVTFSLDGFNLDGFRGVTPVVLSLMDRMSGKMR